MPKFLERQQVLDRERAAFEMKRLPKKTLAKTYEGEQ